MLHNSSKRVYTRTLYTDTDTEILFFSDPCEQYFLLNVAQAQEPKFTQKNCNKQKMLLFVYLFIFIHTHTLTINNVKLTIGTQMIQNSKYILQ